MSEERDRQRADKISLAPAILKNTDFELKEPGGLNAHSTFWYGDQQDDNKIYGEFSDDLSSIHLKGQLRFTSKESFMRLVELVLEREDIDFNGSVDFGLIPVDALQSIINGLSIEPNPLCSCLGKIDQSRFRRDIGIVD